MVDRLTGKPVHLDISDLPMRKGVITNRTNLILEPSGSGKSFFTNHMVRQYYEQGTHVLLIDTGNSYQGLCNLIHNKTGGEDGIYFTYEENDPIAFNPFLCGRRRFRHREKRRASRRLSSRSGNVMTSHRHGPREVALSNAVNLFLEKIRTGRQAGSLVQSPPMSLSGTSIGEILKEKRTREKDFDVFNFPECPRNLIIAAGEYDFLLNSDKQLDLLGKRFIVFELDNIKDNKVLFPIVTIIIMETFINKMRRLKGIRKMILLEEAWKAISKEGMAEYLKIPL